MYVMRCSGIDEDGLADTVGYTSADSYASYYLHSLGQI